jgi:hypothetical protein
MVYNDKQTTMANQSNKELNKGLNIDTDVLLKIVEESFNKGVNWGVTYSGWFVPTEDDNKRKLEEAKESALEIINPIKKRFYISNQIGLAKHIVNYSDGIKKHSDGSAFFDIQILKNKTELNRFVLELKKLGYKEMFN